MIYLCLICSNQNKNSFFSTNTHIIKPIENNTLILSININGFINEENINTIKTIKDNLTKQGIRIERWEVKKNNIKFYTGTRYNKCAKQIITNVNNASSYKKEITNDYINIKLSEQNIESCKKNIKKVAISMIYRKIKEFENQEKHVKNTCYDKVFIKFFETTNTRDIKYALEINTELKFYIIQDSKKNNIQDFANSKLINLEKSVKFISVYNPPLINKRMIKNLYINKYINNKIRVNFILNNRGKKIFEDSTLNNIGKFLAIEIKSKILNTPLITNKISTGSGAIFYNSEKISNISLIKNINIPVIIIGTHIPKGGKVIAR